MTATATSIPTDPRHFRNVLGNFASGIAVITAIHNGEPVGLTCQSFSSVSLDPPLVTFIPAKTSGSYPRIREAGRFGINILASGQEEVCRQMATSGGPKFDGVEWSPSEGGAPRLAGSLAFIDCELQAELDGGDHLLVLGRVTGLEADPEADPLLFFRGSYQRIGLEEATL
jgi:3-hydroxy-9,10-secoandrosta-1,3,5(10)-triene-9,17-dione monooxygenase reductase component